MLYPLYSKSIKSDVFSPSSRPTALCFPGSHALRTRVGGRWSLTGWDSTKRWHLHVSREHWIPGWARGARQQRPAQLSPSRQAGDSSILALAAAPSPKCASRSFGWMGSDTSWRRPRRRRARNRGDKGDGSQQPESLSPAERVLREAGGSG